MKKRSYKSCLVFFILLSITGFTPLIINAQQNRVNTEIVYVKKTNDFKITGNGSAENWSHTGWNKVSQRGDKELLNANWRIPAGDTNRKVALLNTDFKILYSDKGIYCLFRCEDSLITATLKADYLNLFNEDVVEAFFWPDTSMPVYFEYELSPLNFELPLLNVNKKGKLMNWQPWRYEGAKKTIHAVQINERNESAKRRLWYAEFFIPFALIESLGNLPPAKGTRWRGNFYRIDYDAAKPVYSSWKLVKRNFNDYENFGILEFE